MTQIGLHVSKNVGRWCKTHLLVSKNLLQELSGMSSYQELLPEELQITRKIRKIPKMTIFRDELFGGSSDFNNEIWSEMESLGVLDVFCTYSECNTTYRSNFKKKSIFAIFDIFICGIANFDIRNFYQKVNSRSTNHFFMIYHQKPLPEKKCNT